MNTTGSRVKTHFSILSKLKMRQNSSVFDDKILTDTTGGKPAL